LPAASSNQKLKLLDSRKAKAIKIASKEVLSGNHDSQFPLDVFQTGSGTSTNMNANEVIANLASKKARIKINANDHVNMSQSSNDVIPTAICISALLDTQRLLLPSLEGLIKVIDKKASSLKGQVKTGRTHLMDAMPIDFSQELSGWSAQLKAVEKSIISASKEMAYLPQGGTAIGTGVNAHKDFGKLFAAEVSKLTKLNVKTSTNYFKSLSAQDSAAQLSSSVKNLSLVLTKISNDLRWMNSGPLTGLGEIELEALQPGSSIMPGKVNPVIPEAVAMACADVIGNDVTVSYSKSVRKFSIKCNASSNCIQLT
jgi:fumarate hydratase class II